MRVRVDPRSLDSDKRRCPPHGVPPLGHNWNIVKKKKKHSNVNKCNKSDKNYRTIMFSREEKQLNKSILHCSPLWSAPLLLAARVISEKGGVEAGVV